jgi:hypothetical protein
MRLEPSRAGATIGHGLGTSLVITVIAVVELNPHGALARYVPDPITSILSGTTALTVAAVLVCLTATATVANGLRWRTARAVERFSNDPALVSVMPTAPKACPRAATRPRLTVDEVRPPLFRQRPRPLRRATETQNVVGRRPLSILYLRVFENRVRARTFVRGAWREFGHVHLLRTAAAVDPAEFRAAQRAKRLGRLFLSSSAALDAALAEVPQAPHAPGWRRERTIAGSSVAVRDRYGSYPVRSLICHGTFWRAAVAELLPPRVDLVVLDLSGFLPDNAGTAYELQTVVDTVPIARVLLLADPYSDIGFLRGEVEAAWENMAAGSPNAGAPHRQVTVEIAVVDRYYRRTYQSSSGTTQQSRLELHAVRAQTRWLLARAHRRLDGLPTPSGRSGAGHRQPPQPADPPPPPTPPATPPPPPQRRAGALTAAVLAVLAVLIAVAVLILAPSRVPGWVPLGGHGIAATVRPGDGYVVRSGPSMVAERVDVLHGGTAVAVDCLDGSWARLTDPHPGRYVAAKGLDLATHPSPC